MYGNDGELLTSGRNHRSIAHRFAFYLEPLLSGLTVDCEYSEFGDELPSRLSPSLGGCLEAKGSEWIIPDVVVHSRDAQNPDKLAIVEIRSASALDGCDRLKLKEMTSKNGSFGYDFGLGVEFYAGHCERILFSDGEQTGEPMSLGDDELRSSERPPSPTPGGLAARSQATMEARANAVAMAAEADKKVASLSPETAVERYNYLESKPITELSESEYAERLALAEKMSKILKELRKQKRG